MREGDLSVCSAAASLLVLACAAGWELKGALKADQDLIEQKLPAEQQRRVAAPPIAKDSILHGELTSKDPRNMVWRHGVVASLIGIGDVLVSGR